MRSSFKVSTARARAGSMLRVHSVRKPVRLFISHTGFMIRTPTLSGFWVLAPEVGSFPKLRSDPATKIAPSAYHCL